MYINKDEGIKFKNSYISAEEIEELVQMLGVDEAFDTVVHIIETAEKKKMSMSQKDKLEDEFIKQFGIVEFYHQITQEDLKDLGL